MKVIVSLLKDEGRLKLSEISRRTGLPESTVFEYMKLIKKEYDFTIRKKDGRDVYYCVSCGREAVFLGEQYSRAETENTVLIYCEKCGIIFSALTSPDIAEFGKECAEQHGIKIV
jgi:DNA-directed RNA polymerase subunit M/transcription elongation factor TFIIS